jgi:hypothetical protein
MYGYGDERISSLACGCVIVNTVATAYSTDKNQMLQLYREKTCVDIDHRRDIYGLVNTEQ